MAFSIIPADDPKQALRIRRTLLAMGMALVHFVMCWAMYFHGSFRLSLSGLLIFFAALWAGHFSILAIIRTGLNKRFHDPSLTFLQIAWTAACVMFTAYFLNELRPVVLMLFLVGMLFGFLRLNFKSFVWLSIYASLLYAGLMGLLYRFHPEAVDPHEEIIVWFCFSLVTACFAVMGRVISQMREALRKQNIQLSKEIEERKKAQEQTQFRKAYFEGLVDNMPDAIAIFDDDGRITEINSPFAAMFGYSEAEALGKNISDLVSPPDRLQEAHGFRQRITSGEVVDVETVRMRKDGSLIHVSLRSATVIVDRQRIGHFVIYRDISSRKQAEKERVRLEFQLQESRKMEAIATLAGGIAHEFNNALTTILGNLDLLEMENRQDEKTSERLKAVKESGYHMAHLTGQLLAYARGGKYNAQVMCLSEFAGETLALVEHSLGSLVRLETDLPADIGWVKADPTQMQMVLTAIVSNANEAIDGRGCIRVSTRNVCLDAAFTRGFRDLSPGPYVCVSIEDDGKGMDKETLQRIFEPFFTTHFFGRGLGMSAVYGIVTNHHGIITVDSEPGKGTKVQVYLPSARGEGPVRQPSETVQESGSAPYVGRGTILIIEDEETVLKINREIVERLGYRALAASTGEKAVHMAAHCDAAIDLALLDIKLPDMTGNQLYPLMKKLRPEMKVIVCSGYAIDGPVQEILDMGADGFIQKPFSVTVLSEKLRNVLHDKGNPD